MNAEIIHGFGLSVTAEQRITPPTAAAVKDMLDYDPNTGVFIWKKSFRSVKAGSKAGSTGARGRRTIGFGGSRYYAHRLAWLISTGKWPSEHIDHIDGNPLNNRICNLRECNDRENHQNMKLPSSNKSGLLGVSWKADKKKWVAQIRTEAGVSFLGYFSSKTEAGESYAEAKERLHTFNPSVPARASRQQAGVA